jgi:hypothetical protein
MVITSSGEDLRHSRGPQGELSHESNRRFCPCIRHHRRERHHLSGDSQAACDCLAGGTVHRSQLLAAQPAHQTQTGAPRDPSAGLVTDHPRFRLVQILGPISGSEDERLGSTSFHICTGRTSRPDRNFSAEKNDYRKQSQNPAACDVGPEPSRLTVLKQRKPLWSRTPGRACSATTQSVIRQTGRRFCEALRHQT